MKFFVDSADIAEIKELAATGLVDGVTTNPSLIAKSGRDFKEVVAEICQLVSGPVSAEVTATDTETMIKQANILAQLADNVCIKLPLTWDGLKATRTLTEQGRQVNVTLCFSATQALLAAKAGADFISPFVGRLDDIGEDGMALIGDIHRIYANYPQLKTEILVASVRSVQHVAQAALIGAHVATLPPAILRDLIQHELTDKGLAAFLNDWEKSGQSIL
ncbi:MAG: fructose-6-phosphate aldolase [Alphaproteobacteria bacterium]|nr:fructose-6-phosphate aldolase [Alphaproteobacteria bacterium]